MIIQTACKDLLEQLITLTRQLSAEQYSMPLPVLSGNTLGKHMRHIIEFYDVLLQNCESGHINYDLRRHDHSLETHTYMAIHQLRTLSESILAIPVHIPLQLSASLSPDAPAGVQVETTVYRELLYNVEHTIHHMAIMAIAVRQHFPDVVVPENFGIAYSTVRYQTQQRPVDN